MPGDGGPQGTAESASQSRSWEDERVIKAGGSEAERESPQGRITCPLIPSSFFVQDLWVGQPRCGGFDICPWNYTK